MTIWRYYLILPVVCAACAMPPVDQQLTADDVDAIRELNLAYPAAWLANDPDAVMADLHGVTKEQYREFVDNLDGTYALIRCGARTKRGKPCRCGVGWARDPAHYVEELVEGKRCKLHQEWEATV